MTVVVDVYRGGAVENRHHGHIAVVNDRGQILYSVGDPYMKTYGRSALKPFQILPLIETGTAAHFQFDNADIAVCCASHSGEAHHCSKVKSILNRIGVEETELLCGPEDPIDKKSYETLIRGGGAVSPVCNGCSGVHAGMIATAIHMHEDYSGYTQLNHPVQQRVMDAVSELTDVPATEIATAIDGCGIPTYLLPLHHLALGYTRLARPDRIDNPLRREAIKTVVKAILERPEMVTGRETYTTRLMKLFHGRLIAKEGAQGVYGISDLDTGFGIALKIEDGSPTEIPAVVNQILQELGIGLDGQLHRLRKDMNPEIRNAPGQVVGHMETTFTLVKH